ncbi:MAG TPA: hypothetical protein VGD58_18000 [Herpetosiphonaceae bacterium]
MLFTIGIGLFVFLVLILTVVASAVLTRDWFGARVARQQTVVLMGGLIGMALISLALYLILPDAWRAAVWLAFQLGFVCVGVALMVRAVILRRRSGAILLDLGPIPGSQFILITGGITLVLTLPVVFLVMLSGDYASGNTWSEGLFRIAFCVFLLFFGTSRCQIREAGIFYQHFIPWHTIQAYHWEQDRPTTLTLSVQTWWPLGRERHLSIPMHNRDTVNAILAQRIAPLESFGLRKPA